MKYTNTKMTWKDMDKYSQRELFRMWQEQNPNKTIEESVSGVVFSYEVKNEFIRFECVYETKLDIYKPVVIESHPLFVNGNINMRIA